MMRRILLLGLLCITISASAQDPIFSQFYSTPLQLNPAFAGVTYAPRITLNYRNQYPNLPNAYATYAATYEQSVEALNSGFGLIAMTDAAGDGIYKTTRISGVFGYKVRIRKEHVVKFGVQAGVIQSSVDWDRLVFPDQLDEVYGQTDGAGNTLISEEMRPESLNRTIPDISAGILYYSPRFHAGFSVKHLNSPDDDLLLINNNLQAGLPLRFTVHGGWEVILEQGNNRRPPTFISPNVMFAKQGDFGQINGGVYAGVRQFFGGLWYRHTFSNPDAIIALVGYKVGVMRIGYSFDLTISELANAPGGTGGTHEISLSFNFEDSKEFKRRKAARRYVDCFNFLN
jgi:type IX secretion system PorP/SprF family membrane protein